MINRSKRIESTVLEEFIYEVFTAGSLNDEHSVIMTDALMCASLRGVDTHGVVRVEPYSRKLDEGGYNSSPEITISEPSDSVAIVDADNGPGPIAGYYAMEHAITIAKESGVGATVVKNSNHFGMAAYYTLYAAERDCIGLTMSQGGPRVAPYGGTDPFFGTNPLAYSVPTNREFTITLDMSTSAGANAKIRRAKERGEQIPKNWAIDGAGHPTTDPSAVHALRPVGGAKGYGLGLLVDICSGILPGMDFAPAVNTPFDDYSKPMRIGHFMLALDMGTFRNFEDFKMDIDVLIDRIKSISPANGFDEVRLPGERSDHVAAERERNGIPLDRKTIEKLVSAGDRYGISFPEPSEDCS